MGSSSAKPTTGARLIERGTVALAALGLSCAAMLSACTNSTVPAQGAVVASPPPLPGGFEPPEAQGTGRDCFWSLTEEMNYLNVFYLEEYANYWISALVIPPGGKIRIRGVFPHSRYMSFNLYSPTFKPIDVLADIDIEPDEGSVNPFIAGQQRQAPRRSYIVQIVPEQAPASGEAANTLYNVLPLDGVAQTIEPLLPAWLLDADLPSNVVIMIYRVYLPDTATSRSGGVDLPDIQIIGATGGVISPPAICSFLEPALPTFVNDFLATAQIGPIKLGLSLPPSTGALPEVKWFKYFDLLSTYIHHLEAIPVFSGPTELAALDFARNLDNSYLMGYVSQSYGPLVSLHAKVPTHRHTVRGEPTAEDAEVRYFSFCSDDFYTRRTYGCVYDEEIPSRDGGATILVGRPADRPANATYECGVAWLDWGLLNESMLVYRQMNPGETPASAKAIRNVPFPAGSGESDVMGDTYPRSRYWSTEAFEALGCPVQLPEF